MVEDNQLLLLILSLTDSLTDFLTDSLTFSLTSSLTPSLTLSLPPLDTPGRPQQCQARDLGAASVVVECLNLNLPNTLGQVFVLELYQVSQMRGLAALTNSHLPGLPAHPAGAERLPLLPPLDAGAAAGGEAVHGQDLREQRGRPQSARHHESRHA